MKTLKKMAVAIALVAVGAVAAYAECPGSITVTSGGKTFTCSYVGSTSGGGCVYGNCTEKKVAELAAVESEAAY